MAPFFRKNNPYRSQPNALDNHPYVSFTPPISAYSRSADTLAVSAITLVGRVMVCGGESARLRYLRGGASGVDGASANTLKGLIARQTARHRDGRRPLPHRQSTIVGTAD